MNAQQMNMQQMMEVKTIANPPERDVKLVKPYYVDVGAPWLVRDQNKRLVANFCTGWGMPYEVAKENAELFVNAANQSEES